VEAVRAQIAAGQRRQLSLSIKRTPHHRFLPHLHGRRTLKYNTHPSQNGAANDIRAKYLSMGKERLKKRRSGEMVLNAWQWRAYLGISTWRNALKNMTLASSCAPIGKKKHR